METEVWKDVKEFLGYYQVSNLGRCRSVERTVTFSDGRVRTFKSKILKPFISKQGYPTATLSVNGRNFKRTVHRMVAITFLGNFSETLEVNHIDGNKRNNRLDNLEWVTHSENHNHFHSISRNNSGERSHLSKLKDVEVREVRKLHSEGMSSREISNIFKVDYKTVWRIVTYRTWKYL